MGATKNVTTSRGSYTATDPDTYKGPIYLMHETVPLHIFVFRLIPGRHLTPFPASMDH